MPLYEFQCERCGVILTLLLPFEEGAKAVCPTCSGPVRRRYSSFSFRTKYPLWVDRIDDHQKRQADSGLEPTLPSPDKVLW